MYVYMNAGNIQEEGILIYKELTFSGIATRGSTSLLWGREGGGERKECQAQQTVQF